MKIKIEKDNTIIKPSGRGNSKYAIILVILLIILAGVMLYRCNTIETFPKGSYIDGTDVSGLTPEEAEEAVIKNKNEITISMDKAEPVKVKTKFTYDIKDSLEAKMRLAAMDIRQLAPRTDYKVPLVVSDGIEKTAKALEKAIPISDHMLVTRDAYIDLDKMEIVEAVLGDSPDYTAITEMIAKSREEDPEKSTFEINSKDYIAVPTIYAEDLTEQLAFAKEHLDGGLELAVEGGGKWELTPKDLGEIVKFSPDGPIVDEAGARKIAKRLKEEFNRDVITVDTMEGKRTLVNYVLDDEVDVDRTAESILNAVQTGEKGMVCLSKNAYDDLKTRVEISIPSQTCYFIQNGEVKLKTSVVTGTYNNYTTPGVFSMYYKTRDVVLKGNNDDGSKYESPVSYWMPFNGGIGLHDATWRSTFGGTIWQYSGSHGCVNMPYSEAAKLYDLVDAGTTVIVYD